MMQQSRQNVLKNVHIAHASRVCKLACKKPTERTMSPLCQLQKSSQTTAAAPTCSAFQISYLQAGQGRQASAAHGSARDGYGLWDVEYSHGGLEDARVQVKSVLCDAFSQPCRVWKMLRLKLLVPAVQRVEPILSELLIPESSIMHLMSGLQAAECLP